MFIFSLSIPVAQWVVLKSAFTNDVKNALQTQQLNFFSKSLSSDTQYQALVNTEHLQIASMVLLLKKFNIFENKPTVEQCTTCTLQYSTVCTLTGPLIRLLWAVKSCVLLIRLQAQAKGTRKG